MDSKDVSIDNEIERLPCTNHAESGMRKGITGIGSPGRHCSQCSGLVTENLRELRTETASCPIASRSPFLNHVPRGGNLIDYKSPGPARICGGKNCTASDQFY